MLSVWSTDASSVTRVRFGLPNITSLMQISEDLSSMRSLAKARGYERSRQEIVEGGGRRGKKEKKVSFSPCEFSRLYSIFKR